MSTETERRFLVRVRSWAAVAADATREHLVQAYLAAEPERTVRIRLGAERAVLTVKGPAERGARTEIECAIDPVAARAILDARLFTGTPVEKTRSTLCIGKLVWEVDQFEGGNAGLVLAEVELPEGGTRAAWDSSVDRGRPDWAGREITGEPRFSNSSLALRPFATWPERERADVMREIES
ncbi:MAG TPA: CYTH domain-containing protein [Longimicrobiales bacterium]|nr:CYTH domain-containing protein [Longimicrobiales bacterium]